MGYSVFQNFVLVINDHSKTGEAQRVISKLSDSVFHAESNAVKHMSLAAPVVEIIDSLALPR